MTNLADPRESRVVLVGVGQYEHLDEVPAIKRNLKGLADAFSEPDLWGLPPENCTVLLDPFDPREVNSAIRHAATEVQPDGLLLIYYAGHGLVDPYDGSLLLALSGTDQSVPYEAGLPYEHLRRSVSSSPAKRRVVILDCCYAGRATGQLGGDEIGTSTVAEKAEIDRTCLLVSAPRNRTAQAPHGEPYTAFTGELLRVLRGGVSDRPAILDLITVWREVSRLLEIRSFELPALRAANGGGEIGLVRNAARHHRDLVGRVLVAAPSVDDRDLHQAAVLILRHDRLKGAFGVRINTPTIEPPGDFPTGWRRLITEPAVVFDAGPLSRREGFIAVVRLRPDADPPLRFRPLRERLGVIALSSDPGPLTPALAGLRLFSGYLGWGPEQLEADIDDGLLRLSDAGAELREVLSIRPHEIWTRLHARASEGV